MEKKMSFAGIFQSIFTTTPIGLIPVSIYVLNEQKKLFKKNYELASYISENSQDREVKTHKELINIEGQSYPISEILYFESNKNYINIYTEEDRMFTIRLTMKEMEYLLASYTQFIRCHRAYIVNSDKIVNVEGNAQGLKLFFSKTTSFVPVSRSYISKVDPVIRPNE
jgi:DNA-binding LytR/AlgR family response regulator